jgi:hypothetical protein
VQDLLALLRAVEVLPDLVDLELQVKHSAMRWPAPTPTPTAATG